MTDHEYAKEGYECLMDLAVELAIAYDCPGCEVAYAYVGTRIQAVNLYSRDGNIRISVIVPDRKALSSFVNTSLDAKDAEEIKNILNYARPMVADSIKAWERFARDVANLYANQVVRTGII